MYTHKATECFWQALYFTFSALWGWSILRKDMVLPAYLGGQEGGSLTNFESVLYPTYQEALINYSFVTFGYHAGNLFRHLFIDKREFDFHEMLLHHIAAFSLYFCYIFANHVPIGTVIAYLHDLADVPGNLSKGLSSTVFQNCGAVVFFCCIFTWFVTRIYALPQIIYYIFTELEYQGDLAHFNRFLAINGLYLSVLFSLHTYWFTLFMRILSRLV